MRIGLLAGSVMPHSFHKRAEREENHYGQTSSGTLEFSLGSNHFYVIARHGIPPHIPPHRVDHRANVAALSELDVQAIISICSTGALDPGIKVPSFAVPADYIDLSSGATFMDDEITHITPKLDGRIRKSLLGSCERVGVEAIDGGIYVQARGPRLETRAEVRLISGWGDYVGMNMAPEATLSMELDIPYGALLTVDNYANGVVDQELDFRDILRDARGNWDDILRILKDLPLDL
ncbi:MAG: MTAP family purine nucleoside phosphorylase [Thermoplasmata archaeon]|nr:MTAP family purine nucleoside phosphorylase [Thermoplasmata archaeon]